MPSIPPAEKPCPDCGAPLAVVVHKCRLCGWTTTSTTAALSPGLAGIPQQEVPAEERRLIKQRIQDRQHELARRPAPDLLDHWRAVLGKPGATAAQRMMAKEAIAIMEGRTVQEREVE